MIVKVRVVKVVVQPVLVADDGENLQPVAVQPTEVAAKDWPTYATDQFAEALADLERELNESAAQEIR